MKSKKVEFKENQIAISLDRVIDGDCILATLHLGFDVKIQQRLRLKHFRAPELNGMNPEGGCAAANLLAEQLFGRELSILRHPKKRDKFGRWLVTLCLDGEPVTGDLLIGAFNLSDEQHRADLAFARSRTQVRS